ncbi:hypothetical protein VNO77_27143 [Canavalia gladiata]|uniref:Uncharacterized protein n=1 Tax=Canavalia gladiata TaxID=3824 RepID=A0AAN9Q6V4_CANGL
MIWRETVRIHRSVERYALMHEFVSAKGKLVNMAQASKIQLGKAQLKWLIWPGPFRYNHYRTDGEIQIRPDYYRLGLGKRCSLLSHHSNLYYLHVDFRSRFDINISGIDSCFSFCQNDHNKSAFSWFFMKRDRELPGVFQASSSKYGVIQLGQRGFLLLSILQLSLLSHSLLRHNIFLVFRLLLTTLSQILEDTTSIDQPGLVLNSTFHHLLSVGRGEARQGKPVTELEILNALALDCYPTLYSAKEIECKTWICIWLARFYYLEA